LTSVNYTQLVEIYNKYKDRGFIVLGFPCGQFFNQELSKEEDIKTRIETKYNVEFPMLSKIKVNGDDTHPIYKYLKYNCKELNSNKGLKNIPWNFAKILVDADGKVVGFYGPNVRPEEIVPDIEKLL
jgi:glutathione peroxidase